jgi:hypothetical protein
VHLSLIAGRFSLRRGPSPPKARPFAERGLSIVFPAGQHPVAACFPLAGRVFLSQELRVPPWLRGVSRLRLKGVDLPLLAVLGIAERYRVELGAVISI